MNITRSKSDWWQWSWRLGGNKPASRLDNWVFEPQLTDFKAPDNMRDAMSEALTDISSESDNLVLFYSGGVDSESILTQALEQGTDILPVHMRFVSGSDILNDHEKYHVERFSQKHNIEIEYIDVEDRKSVV